MGNESSNMDLMIQEIKRFLSDKDISKLEGMGYEQLNSEKIKISDILTNHEIDPEERTYLIKLKTYIRLISLKKIHKEF